MTTFLINGAENHKVPTEAAIPQFTILPQSMIKCDENSAIKCSNFDFYAINVTAVPMLTF